MNLYVGYIILYVLVAWIRALKTHVREHIVRSRFWTWDLKRYFRLFPDLQFYPILFLAAAFFAHDRTAVSYLRAVRDVRKRGTTSFQIWLTRLKLVASVTCTWLAYPIQDTTIPDCSDKLNSFQWIIRALFLLLTLYIPTSCNVIIYVYDYFLFSTILIDFYISFTTEIKIILRIVVLILTAI